MLFLTFFLNSVVRLSPTIVTIIIFQSKVYSLSSFSQFALPTSWFLVYDSLKSIMRVTTLFINSVFCWSRKMATIIILASEVSLRSISLFAPDIFIISGLRSSGAYDAFFHFFHRQCCVLVTKDGHNDYLSVESFLLTSLSEFALATSWFLVYESLKSIVRVTTLFIISVVCWSTKIVTIFVLVSEGSLTSFSLFAFSIFLNSGSHSSEA